MRVSVSVALLCLTLAPARPSVVPRDSPHPVVDARRLIFQSSADDGVTDAAGTPLVDSYALQVFVAGTDTLVEFVSLGKPPADPDGKITLPLLSVLNAPLKPGVIYEAVVEAVGPFGVGASERSNAFTFSPPPCDLWIAPVSIDVDAGGGQSATNVHAGPGCAWAAISNDSWLTITSGHGTGDGTVTFIVAPNTQRGNRNGSLSIADVNFRVHQDGAKNKNQ